MLRRAKKSHIRSKDDERSPDAKLPKRTGGASSTRDTDAIHDADSTDKMPNDMNEGKMSLPVLGMPSQVQDTEEALLEKYILGGQQSFVENLKKEERDNRGVGILEAEQRKPAWEDEDDEDASTNKESSNEAITPTNSGTVFSQRRKIQFEKVVGSKPSWAQLQSKTERNADSEDDSDTEDEDRFLRTTGNYLTTSESLPKGVLRVRKVTNANKEQYTKGKLCAMEFHPTSQVMLTAGEDCSLHIFQVDGKYNPKIQSVAMEQFPILGAHFSADGTEVIMSSRSRWYSVYDMIAGKVQRMSFLKEYHERQPVSRFTVSPDGSFMAFQGLYGFIHLVTAKNKELMSSLKMNGTVSSLAFSSDGSKLFSFGEDGEVYIWDMKTRDCVHKFADDGCIKGTTIAVSRNGQHLACGSQSGVVNIYDTNQCLTNVRPKPIRAIMNLTTSVTESKFNSTSEILAISSFHVKTAVKLVHLPDCHIFPNFPLSADSVGLATLIDFSPNSGYMAVGNSSGRALLYRLGHYKDY